MTKLGQHLEKIKAPYESWKAASANFANVAKTIWNSVYSIQNESGVSVNSIWGQIEYPILKNIDIIYGVVSGDGNIHICP